MIGTFGYKGQHYLSKDLIDFCQHKTPTDFHISESFLKNKHKIDCRAIFNKAMTIKSFLVYV